MCYDEMDYSLDSFNGVKVSVKGVLGDESYNVADVYIEDGSGVERLVKLLESERGEWDSFGFGVQTVTSIDMVIYDEMQHRRIEALVGLFFDQFEYKCIDEKGVEERLNGIAEVTGNRAQIGRQYMALLYQVDESLVPDDWKRIVEDHPRLVDERRLEIMRKYVPEK